MYLIPRKHETRRNAFSDLVDIQKEINNLFGFSLSRWGADDRDVFENAWVPAIDVYDSKEDLVVKTDLPGIKKEDIEVSINDGTLTIKGEKKEELRKKEDGVVRTERLYGAFQREILLPTAVDSNNVKAIYKDGVLELRLPKKEEAKPKQIKVDIG